MDPQQSSSSDSEEVDRVCNRSIVIPAQLIDTTEDGFEKKEQSWFATTQIPTDLTIQVQDITFYVHKMLSLSTDCCLPKELLSPCLLLLEQYPLVARCGYLARTDLQLPNQHSRYDLQLESFPGGSEAFEIVLKFCSGLPIGLTTNNVAALRCASEYLEMTEALEDGNLIAKTEAFFTFMVLPSWRDSITVLKSCETLSPWAENLQIVRRCCNSIAWKVSRREDIREQDWWFEDLDTLRIDHFTRIITALKAKGVKPETIGSCITQYAEKWLPSLDVEKEGIGRLGYGKNALHWNITSGGILEGAIGQTREHRTIIESLVSILPPHKEAVSCKFLLRMLKMAIMYSASPALISDLEKRVAMVLENANASDLLIPSYTAGDQGKPINLTGEHSMHNIEVVQRILEYFLMYEQQQQQQKPGTVNISKLLDNYLAEIARDPNLSINKFKVLVESLPENARICDDGLYRAIDTYLKTHPSLSEHERRRLCKIMNCEKLSLDACSHAAQNDRLPLRTVIQILYSEQVKMRAAIQGKDQVESDENLDHEGSWSCTKTKVNTLKAELKMVKVKMAELQRDYFELQQEYEKLNSQRNLWTFGWLKIKKSALHCGKVDGEDTGEGQPRSNSDRKTRFHRRQSIS